MQKLIVIFWVFALIFLVGVANYSHFTGQNAPIKKTIIAPASTDGIQPSVMEFDKTQHEPIKFVDGVAHATINVDSIITVDCPDGAHCISYLKAENGPHYMIGSLLGPGNFGISTTYHCSLSHDETELAAAVIDCCDEIGKSCDYYTK